MGYISLALLTVHALQQSFGNSYSYSYGSLNCWFKCYWVFKNRVRNVASYSISLDSCYVIIDSYTSTDGPNHHLTRSIADFRSYCISQQNKSNDILCYVSGSGAYGWLLRSYVAIYYKTANHHA